MSRLSVVILTFNEALHISRAISSVKNIAHQVFVVDSYSTDSTVEIARKHGAVVFSNKFENYSKQFQWALDHCPIDTEWIMRLDADEIIEPDLANQIACALSALRKSIVGINLQRKHIWMDRWIKHGGRYPLTLLRIWRRGHGRIEDRWMDEHIVVSGGETIALSGGFADHNLNDLSFFTEKHNKYATREAIDVLNDSWHFLPHDNALDRRATSKQAAWKRWFKISIYNRVPFEFASLLYFLYRFIFQLGFLDGRAGLSYHFLQGFWYRFLVGAKVRELRAAISDTSDAATVRAKLSKLTGLKI